MKNNLLTLATILTIVFFSNNVNAQIVTATTSSNALASATIVTPISIVRDGVDLSFGDITSGGTVGAVVLTPAAGATASGGVGLVAGSTPTVPKYTVSGQENKAFTITLPSSALTLTGGTGVTIGTFTASIPTTTSTILSGGTPFTVGATLNVGASSPAGAYSVAFPVTVNYN